MIHRLGVQVLQVLRVVIDTVVLEHRVAHHDGLHPPVHVGNFVPVGTLLDVVDLPRQRLPGEGVHQTLLEGNVQRHAVDVLRDVVFVGGHERPEAENGVAGGRAVVLSRFEERPRQHNFLHVERATLQGAGQAEHQLLCLGEGRGQIFGLDVVERQNVGFDNVQEQLQVRAHIAVLAICFRPRDQIWIGAGVHPRAKRGNQHAPRVAVVVAPLRHRLPAVGSLERHLARVHVLAEALVRLRDVLARLLVRHGCAEREGNLNRRIKFDSNAFKKHRTRAQKPHTSFSQTQVYNSRERSF